MTPSLSSCAVKLFVERDDAGKRSVRHMHVADAAARGFRDFAPVCVHPIEITRPRLLFAAFTTISHAPSGVDLELILNVTSLPAEILEIGVNVLIRMRFLSIHRDQVVARLSL